MFIELIVHEQAHAVLSAVFNRADEAGLPYTMTCEKHDTTQTCLRVNVDGNDTGHVVVLNRDGTWRLKALVEV